MNYKLLIFICVLLGTIMSSCVPDTGNQMTDIVISMSDPEIQKITDLKDKQDLKGLYDYFRNENPSYRYQAVIAFASIKKAEANDSLVAMLQDPVMQVRSAAAFAIGQSGDSKITDRLILSFRGKDTLNVNNIFNANVLTSRMVDLLYTASVPKEVKVLAAQYFGRAKDINLSLSKVRLTDIFTRERNPDIRMALATAFGKSKDIDFLPALKTAMIAETDYRVKCNVMRALGNFPYIEFRDIAFKNLKNDNLHIASTAAGVFMSNGFIEDVPEYMKYDTVTIPWQVRAKMNGAVLF